LAGYGMEIIDRVPIRSEPNLHNARYLLTKKKKLGHMI
jgi:3,4-dihydroxy 2-butanone 4-phosphate synthase/GTP cyclohydrolase II